MDSRLRLPDAVPSLLPTTAPQLPSSNAHRIHPNHSFYAPIFESPPVELSAHQYASDFPLMCESSLSLTAPTDNSNKSSSSSCVGGVGDGSSRDNVSRRPELPTGSNRGNYTAAPQHASSMSAVYSPPCQGDCFPSPPSCSSAAVVVVRGGALTPVCQRSQLQPPPSARYLLAHADTVPKSHSQQPFSLEKELKRPVSDSLSAASSAASSPCSESKWSDVSDTDQRILAGWLDAVGLGR